VKRYVLEFECLRVTAWTVLDGASGLTHVFW